MERQQALNLSQQLLNTGMAHHRAGRLREAESIYRQVLAAQPGNADALQLLGSLAADVGKLDAAIELIVKAIAVNPGVAQYHANLGAIYARCNRFDEAISALGRAIELDPDMVIAYFNLGGVLGAKFEFARAIPVLQKAVSLDPNWPELQNRLGVTLRNDGQYQAARAIFRKLAESHPDFAEGRWNLGLTLLVMGDLENGWKEYEWGKRTPNVSIPRGFPQPQWMGEDISGKTILIHAELGFGDTLNFVRYAPLVAARAAKVIVECQPELARLLRGIADISQIVVQGHPLPPFDVHCPMTSLPLSYGTTLQTIPANVPYLSAAADRITAWRQRVGDVGRKCVGLVWAGRSDHKNDRQRSIRLQQFSPLAEVKSARFFSLQKSPAAQQMSAPPPGIDLLDYSAELTDFAETAALVANLDLVISVDTSTAHLAGAMGKPVWVLVPFVPDYRWMLNRPDTPWYPTMRLYRQPKQGDWDSVLANVTRDLREFQ
jgi:Tfp pilus assembly protein PilF